MRAAAPGCTASSRGRTSCRIRPRERSVLTHCPHPPPSAPLQGPRRTRGPPGWSAGVVGSPPGRPRGVDERESRPAPSEPRSASKSLDHRLGLVVAVMGQQQDLEPPRTSDVGEGLPPGLSGHRRRDLTGAGPVEPPHHDLDAEVPPDTSHVRGIVVRARSEGVIDMTDDEWSRNRLSPSLAEPRPRGRASRSNRRHR